MTKNVSAKGWNPFHIAGNKWSSKPPSLTWNSTPAAIFINGVPSTANLSSYVLYNGVSALTYSVNTGSLPTGVTLNAATGLLTYTGVQSSTSTATFHVTDGSVSADSSSVSLVIVDNIAPSVPTGLTGYSDTGNQVHLSWNASTDNVGVTSYRVYRDGSIVGTSATTSYLDGPLPDSTYTYSVSAGDLTENWSAQSSFINVLVGTGSVTFDYYISPTGSDLNPGTISQPWAITALSNKPAIAGKRVGLLDGTYHLTTSLSSYVPGGGGNGYYVSIAYGGTAGAPTVVQAVNARNAVFTNDFDSGSYSIAVMAPYVEVRDLTAHGLGFTFAVAWASHVLFDGLHVYDIVGERAGVSTGDNVGCVSCGQFAEYVTFNNCLLHDVYNVGTTGQSVNASGIGPMFRVNNTTISNCTIYNVAVAIRHKWGVGNFTAFNNFTYNCTFATDMAEADSAYWPTTRTRTVIHNNIIVGGINGYNRETVNMLPTPTDFYNNTFVAAATTAWNGGDSPMQFANQSPYPIVATSGTKFYNNIFTTYGAQSTSWAGWMLFMNITNNRAQDWYSLMDYNCYGPTGYFWSTSNNSTSGSLAAWKTNTGGMEQHTINVDPLLTNQTGTSPSDFTLQAGSLCKTSGKSDGTSSGASVEMGAWGGASPPTSIGHNWTLGFYADPYSSYATRYVDAATGVNSPGSTTYLTIQYGANDWLTQGGRRLIVRSGNYQCSGDYNNGPRILSSGTSDNNRIVIQGDPTAASAPVLDTGWDGQRHDIWVLGQWVTIRKIKFDGLATYSGPQTGYVGGGVRTEYDWATSGLIVEYCEFTRVRGQDGANNFGGVNLHGYPNTGRIKIRYNKFSSIGLWNGLANGNIHGVQTYQMANVDVYNNDFTQCSSYVFLKAAGPSNPDDWHIYNNVFRDPLPNSNGPEFVRITSNTLVDTKSWQGVYVYNNLGLDPNGRIPFMVHPDLYECPDQPQDIVVYNNTIIGTRLYKQRGGQFTRLYNNAVTGYTGGFDKMVEANRYNEVYPYPVIDSFSECNYNGYSEAAPGFRMYGANKTLAEWRALYPSDPHVLAPMDANSVINWTEAQAFDNPTAGTVAGYAIKVGGPLYGTGKNGANIGCDVSIIGTGW